MNDYAKLRIALQRISLGKHEDHTPLTLKYASAIATAALLCTADTAEEHIYLCGECPECGHPCKIDDETHYARCSRARGLTP